MDIRAGSRDRLVFPASLRNVPRASHVCMCIKVLAPPAVDNACYIGLTCRSEKYKREKGGAGGMRE